MGNIFSKRRKKVEITPVQEEETITVQPNREEYTSSQLEKHTQEVEDDTNRIMEERRARRNEAKLRKQEQQQDSEDLT